MKYHLSFSGVFDNKSISLGEVLDQAILQYFKFSENLTPYPKKLFTKKPYYQIKI